MSIALLPSTIFAVFLCLWSTTSAAAAVSDRGVAGGTGGDSVRLETVETYFGQRVISTHFVSGEAVSDHVDDGGAGTGEDFVRLETYFDQRVISTHFGGVSAVEITSSDGPRIGFIIRQITDGHMLIQSVHDEQLNMKECKVDKDETKIQNFIAKVKSLSHDDGTTSYTETASDLDFSYKFNSTRSIKTRPILEKNKYRLPNQLQSVLDMKTAKFECRHLGKILKESLRHRDSDDVSKKASEDALRRSRRDMLIFPGTLWCGVGNSAKDRNELGEEKTVDQCCRKHDFCPDFIERFTTGYGLFNHRLYTISDCRCDLEFLGCLKNTGSSLGQAVARAYFNVFALQCFKLVPEDRCVEFGWWGRCMRRERVQMAHLDQVGPIESLEVPPP